MIAEDLFEFWRTTLVGAPRCLQLASDRSRSALAQTNFATVSVATGAALAANDPDPAYDLLLSAIAVAAHRYSGQDDIVLGCAVRDTLLPMRIDLSDEPTLAAVQTTVRAAMANVRLHAGTSVNELVAALAIDIDPSHAPLVQVIFEGLQSDALPSLDNAAERLAVTSTSYADLCLRASADDGSLGLHAAYNTALFDEATIDDFLVRIAVVLAAFTQDGSTTTVGRVTLLNDVEQRAQLAAARGPVVPMDERRVHDVIAERIREFPDAPAISDAAVTLTYREYDEAATALAHALLATGLQPESFVALALPRGPALVTAILAVHRCGCAYVPLEPSYPTERLEFMVSDSQAQLMIATPALRGLVAEYTGATVLIDDAGSLVEQSLVNLSDEAVLPVPVASNALAYMIYTSGSTGLPKGVMIEHRSLVNLMHQMAEHPGLRAGQVMVGVTTPAFDLSIPDLFLPLTTGAHLVLASPQVAADPVRLMELLERVDVDVMQATPATWRMLIDAGWRGRPNMRVVCGGEGYTSALAKPLAARVGELWNFYGPTEATVWCTSAHLAMPEDPLPLGRALANYGVFVADAAGSPVPHGVAGELMISGDGLARGYHNREELTADRFVMVGGQRCYRTGDLARTRRDGSFEFLGRIDHQVKLRGFRIELGEIESALAAQPGVREVVVVVREDTPGDQRLVGYVVADGVEPDALRRAIAQRLPTYMVPSVVVVLDDLPRTPNGKTNRNALPIPAQGPTSLAPYVPPRGDIEQAVADIWVEVLGVERVGIHDDFFDLGGHSLRITQVVSRVRDAFNVELSLSDLYSNPTVEATADTIVMALLDDPHLAELLAEFEG